MADVLIMPNLLPEINKLTLTRSDLANSVNQEVGLSNTESIKLVNVLLNKLEQALVSGENIKLSGFGTFAAKDKSERVGRNPKTGKIVVIEPRRVVVFKPSEKLKSRVNTALSEKGREREYAKL